MWSDLDKLITEFIVKFEKQLGQDKDLKQNLPLDSLQLNINLDQQTQPAHVSWDVSVAQEGQELFNIGHSCEMPSKQT